MKQSMFRQGDVYLIKIDSVPSGVRKAEDRILALGEITGHKHQFAEGATVYRNGGMQYAVLKQPTVLQHEEHANLAIPEGVYEVRIQREFDLVEGTRRVMD